MNDDNFDNSIEIQNTKSLNISSQNIQNQQNKNFDLNKDSEKQETKQTENIKTPVKKKKLNNTQNNIQHYVNQQKINNISKTSSQDALNPNQFYSNNTSTSNSNDSPIQEENYDSQSFKRSNNYLNDNPSVKQYCSNYYQTSRGYLTISKSLIVVILSLALSHWFYIDTIPLEDNEKNSVKNQENQQDIGFLIIVIFALVINLYFTVHFYHRIKICQLNNKKHLIVDLVAGPLALLLDCIWLLNYHNLNWLSVIFRMLKIFTLPMFQKTIKNILKIVPKISKFFLALFSVFYIFTYIATFMYMPVFGKNDSNNFYTSLGYSTFTMLQIMTLDGWGEIGREILHKWGMVPALFLCLFIFIMSYFFWNILIGFILEILRSQQLDDDQKLQSNPMSDNGLDGSDSSKSSDNAKNTKKRKQKELFNKKQQQLKKSETQFPITQEKSNDQIENLIQILSALSIINAFFQTDLSQINGDFSILLHLLVSGIFCLHFLILRKQNQQQLIQQQVNKFVYLFNILSGPTAFFINIYTICTYGHVSHGGYLIIFKIFTLKAIKGIILGSIKILPLLIPPFTAILGIIYILSMWSQVYISEIDRYWKSFNNSVYTFFQILTLDDWCANLIKLLIKSEHYEGPIIFICFIFIANYFFLNIMISISCEKFQEITEENQEEPIYFYEKPPLNAIQQYQQAKSMDFDKFCTKICSLNNVKYTYKQKINQMQDDINGQFTDNFSQTELKCLKKLLLLKQEQKEQKKQKKQKQQQLIKISFDNQNVEIPISSLYINPLNFNQLI